MKTSDQITPSQPSLPEGSQGQFLALGSLAMLVIILSFGVIEPIADWYRARENAVSIQQQEISHIVRKWRLAPGMRQQLAALDAGGDRQIFLPGDSDAIAGANLQSAIASLAEQSNASLASTTIMPVQPMTGLRQIAISVNLTADWKVLIALLGAIDLAYPRMTVSDLSITGSEQAQDTPLQISFTVVAFRAGSTP